jgi:hypothetical protein
VERHILVPGPVDVVKATIDWASEKTVQQCKNKALETTTTIHMRADR